MAAMLGRRLVPGCCPGTRNGRRGVDCDGGWPVGTRKVKRAEGRRVEREIRDQLADREPPR